MAVSGFEVAIGVIGVLGATLYAVWLETPAGQELAARRAWVTVVAGVGLTLVLLGFVLPFGEWLRVAAGFACTGAPMVARSVRGELRRERAVKWGLRDGDEA